MNTKEFTKRTIVVAVVAVIAMITYKTTLYEIVQMKKAYAEEQESIVSKRTYQLEHDAKTEEISRERYESGKVFCKTYKICDLYKGAYPGKVKANPDRVPGFLRIQEEYDISLYIH